MSAEQDIATIRRGYEAFNSGDMETLTGIFAEEASWHTPGRASLAGDHIGRDDTFGYFARLGGDTGGTFRAELKDLMADGNGHVVGIHQVVADKDGRHLDVECCLVFELKDGRVVDGREHFEDLYAWDEFWA